ncbi:MAG: hypothetical protein ACLU5H_06360 [Alphaproteobacteria bacterium]|jgi:hypothetical protein
MILTKLVILDRTDKEANVFVFSDKANIITSDDSYVGKSCLLKSMFYAMGFPIRVIQSGWILKNKLFKLYYIHDNKEGFIIRSGDTYWVDDVSEALSTMEYSKWLLQKYNLNIRLPLKDNVDIRTVYPSAIILPFYVDQDVSWSAIPYKNVANDLSQYASSVIPSALFEYLFGISTNVIMDKKQERLYLSNEKNSLGQQYDTLSMLKDDFIRKDTEEYTFNEQEAINDIKRYLSLAEGINVKLNEFKSSIYQKKIEVDNLKVETLELTKIIENTRHSYNEIRDVCAHCGSDLTEQQSMMRIRLENDQYEATLLRNDLDRKIKKLEAEIDSILQGKLGFENEYASLLSIAEKKQGEITLQQFIEQKAQKLAKTNYVEVKNTLNEKIADLTERINKLSSEIRILEKQQRVQRDTIGLRFNELKEKLKITFSTASLNELSFLEFKTITASGTVSNVTLFSIYIIYLRLLSEYSVVELPFGFDALIKDELTENNIKLMYETLEKYILNSNKQVFVVMLKDKLKYITGKHNLIELNKPILDKTKYDELLGEFTYMRKL